MSGKPPHKILIVDDSATERHMIGDILEKRGFSVLFAESGERGLVVARLKNPDMMLLDVIMPGMNGYQVRRAISEDVQLKTTPVLFCLSKDQINARLRLNAGEYVIKPIDPEELVRKINTLLSPSVPVVMSKTPVAMTEIGLLSVGVIIGGERWLIDIADIDQVITPVPHLTHVPLCAEWFRGMANIRNNFLSIVDIAHFWRKERVSAHADNCIVSVSSRFAINSGLLVRQSLGLFDTRNWDKDGDFCVDEQGNRWSLLDMNALLTDPNFLNVEWCQNPSAEKSSHGTELVLEPAGT